MRASRRGTRFDDTPSPLRDDKVAERLRDEFLSLISHELRSPLAGIQSWAHVLKQSLHGDGVPSLPPRVERALAGIEAGVLRQGHMVDSLIDAARVLSGDIALRHQVCRIGDIVEAALQRVAVAIAERQLSVIRYIDPSLGTGDHMLSVFPTTLRTRTWQDAVTDDGEKRSATVLAEADGASDWQQLSGDFDRLVEVVYQLLSNAVNFNHPGGVITLRLRAVSGDLGSMSAAQARNISGSACATDRQRVPTGVALSVEDSGAGISAHAMPHLFDSFRQADQSYARHRDGFGLGLSIARRLLQMHGGHLFAESDGEAQGARFTLVLPVLDQAMTLQALPAHGFDGHFPSLSGLSVMVVDDQLEARESLAAVLEQSGAEVLPAASGRDAIAQLEARGAAQEPDVLICDIAMPGEDGYTTLRRIREWEAERGIAPPARLAAIAVTAFAEREDRDRALARGYALHFAKPVDPARLLGAVASLAGK